MPPLKVTLCLGSSCHSRGNRHHVEALGRHLGEHPDDLEVDLKGSLCLGRCAEGPVALVDGETLALGPGDDLVTLVRRRLEAGPTRP